MAGKRTRRHERSAGAPAVAASRDDDPPDDGLAERGKFYGEVIAEVAGQIDDNRIVLNLPVWGYPGHGKTSSILTAIHYCKAHLHGAALAVVSDVDDLAPLAESYPSISDQHFRTLAENTREYLSDLQGRFFREDEYPDATEQPTSYLLELQALPGTLGYVVIPDLRGGSYETSDGVSKNALANAHAMIILVDPAAYADDADPRAADYKKDVLRRIQRCAEDELATCIMITMSDRYGELGDAADLTEKELTCLLTGQRESFKGRWLLRRVSVVGGASRDQSAKPPPARDRKPDELVFAWTWTLHQALRAPRDRIRESPPELDLRVEARRTRIDAPSVPTLRQAGTAENAPGAVIGALSSSNDGTADFLFQIGTNGLAEVRVSAESGEATVLYSMTTSAALPEDAVVQVIGNTMVVGARNGATSLLHGVRGQELIATSLPSALHSWTPIEAKRIIGISENGTIHSLYLRGEIWEDSFHLPSFYAHTPRSTCGYVAQSRMAIVATGTDVVAVDVSVRGRFGDVRRPNIAARFDGEECVLNEDGFFLARTADNIVVGGRDKQAILGPGHPEWPSDSALATAAPYAAWISPTARLRAAALGRPGAMTPEETSPLLSSAPTGMSWSPDGGLMVVTLEDGSAIWFVRYGF